MYFAIETLLEALKQFLKTWIWCSYPSWSVFTVKMKNMPGLRKYWSKLKFEPDDPSSKRLVQKHVQFKSYFPGLSWIELLCWPIWLSSSIKECMLFASILSRPLLKSRLISKSVSNSQVTSLLGADVTTRCGIRATPKFTYPSSHPCRNTSPRPGSRSSSTSTFWSAPSLLACGTA